MGSIKFAVISILLLIWTVIGFVLWIPLLTRTIALLSAAITASAFCTVNLGAARKAMDNAIAFYARGFAVIRDALYLPSRPEAEVADVHDLEEGWMRVVGGELGHGVLRVMKAMLLDLVWTVIFWGVVTLQFFMW